MQLTDAERKAKVLAWALACKPFCRASVALATDQLLATLVPLVATVALMMFLVAKGHYEIFILMPVASGLLVRIFIIQHDCGHGSYLPNQRHNEFLGHFLSVLTFTPYGVWRREHAQHHRGSANLARRGVGDIDLLTVREYVALPPNRKWWYRVIRNLPFLVFFGGPFYFLVLNRFPWGRGFPAREVWKNVLGLDAAIVILYGTLGAYAGYGTVALVIAPTAYIATAIGVWLFYIQHQFESSRWWPEDEWDFQVAAIYGSSYYDLPKWLAWFTGNIGIHHIHHLSIKIPNYFLDLCLAANPELKDLNRLTFRESIENCPKGKLWDEKHGCLVGYP